MEKDDIEQQIAQTHVEEEEFRSLLPTTGWLGDYMKYTDRQESPGSYHFWVGVTILAATLQRKVFLSKGIYEVYPNFYTILIGPSGKCRKSRAMRLGTDLLEGFDWANVMADKTTPEALLAALHVGTPAFQKVDSTSAGPSINLNPNTDSCGLVAASELAVFISKQNYSSGMVGLLTTLYDCPPSFKYLTRNKKPITLTNVAVSLLGASTPEWLATNLPAESFEGGFMSRVIYVVRQNRDRNFAIPVDPEPGQKQKLTDRIEEIHNDIVGEIKLDAEALKWFDDWYTSANTLPILDTSLLGFMERKPDTILKLAIIVAVSLGHSTITANDLRRAHAITTWTQERMFKAFSHVDLSPFGVLQKKIIELLEARGGTATRGDVANKLWGRLQNGVQDLEKAERSLEEAGILKVERPKTNRPGRPAIIYKLVNRNQP